MICEVRTPLVGYRVDDSKLIFFNENHNRKSVYTVLDSDIKDVTIEAFGKYLIAEVKGEFDRWLDFSYVPEEILDEIERYKEVRLAIEVAVEGLEELCSIKAYSNT